MKEKIKKSLKNKFLGQNVPSGDKQKELIILVVGFSFFIVLLVLSRIAYKPVDYSYQEKLINNETIYLDLDKIFINYEDNYNYDISIFNNETSLYTYFNGRIENKIDTGNKKKDLLSINYKIDGNGIINTDNNEVITDLYDGYLYTFFIPSNIYDYIKNLENTQEMLDNKKVYNYNSSYDGKDISFKITTSKDKILEINYLYDNLVYTIKLS